MSLPKMTENQLYNLLNADASVYGEVRRVGDLEERKGGLSKREHFAAMAMQGIMASQWYDNHCSLDVIGGSGRESGAAIKAVMVADELLKALEK
jgi:hypothetical protein